MKKKILSIIAILLVVVGVTLIFTVAIPKAEYAKDSGDTEELYRQNVASVGYENTIETVEPVKLSALRSKIPVTTTSSKFSFASTIFTFKSF